MKLLAFDFLLFSNNKCNKILQFAVKIEMDSCTTYCISSRICFIQVLCFNSEGDRPLLFTVSV